MNLRLHRKQRLAALKGSPDLAQEFGIEKSDKRRYEKEVPTPYVTEPQLKRRNKRDREALPDMWQVKAENLSVKYHPKTASSPEKWVVYDSATEEKLPLVAVYPTADTQSKFATRDFGKELLKRVVAHGPKGLEGYNAVVLTERQASSNSLGKSAHTEDILERFKRALTVALTAQNKNLFDSPLKDAMFRELAEMGVDNPVPIVERVFQAAPAHFDVALKEASKYFNYDDKAFVEIEAMVKSAETVIPTLDFRTNSKVARQSEIERAQAVLGSVPLTTVSDGINSHVSSLRESLPKPKLWGMLKN